MDFGLSTYVPEDETVRLTGVAGTRQFIAPEVYETSKTYRTLVGIGGDSDDDEADASDVAASNEEEGSAVGTETITKTTKGKYGYRCEADVFSLGVTLYSLYSDERLFGDTDGKDDLAKKIMTCDVHWPEPIAERAPMHDFLKRLICPREDRMSLADIRAHEWLADMPWDDIKNGIFAPAFKPPLDRANCDANFELQSQLDHFAMSRAAEKKRRRIDADQQHKFADWDWRLEFAVGALPPAIALAKRDRSMSSPNIARVTDKSSPGAEPSSSNAASSSTAAASSSSKSSSKRKPGKKYKPSTHVRRTQSDSSLGNE
jgi:hypothetical protein